RMGPAAGRSERFVTGGYCWQITKWQNLDQPPASAQYGKPKYNSRLRHRGLYAPPKRDGQWGGCHVQSEPASRRSTPPHHVFRGLPAFGDHDLVVLTRPANSSGFAAFRFPERLVPPAR